MIRIRKTYSEVTFADDDSGDYSEENGFIEEEGGKEGVTMTVRDAISELRSEWRGSAELSQCPVSRESCWGVWATRDASSCYSEASRQESIHLSRVDGEELPSRHLYRIFRAAGLAR